MCLLGGMIQKPSDSKEKFLRELQSKVGKCDFSDPDAMVRDRFLIELRDATLRRNFN